MNHWSLLAREYQRDRLREVEAWRLARIARGGHAPVHRRAMVWLAARLISLGQHLKERYEETASRDLDVARC